MHCIAMCLHFNLIIYSGSKYISFVTNNDGHNKISLLTYFVPLFVARASFTNYVSLLEGCRSGDWPGDGRYICTKKCARKHKEGDQKSTLLRDITCEWPPAIYVYKLGRHSDNC